jgi:CoA:oxalate CoA-transferase
MAQPLDGIKIVDLSHVMAGPFCTRQLALLGADVIKVERPGEGDVMRYYGHDPRFGRNSPNFVGYNAGKRSITLDFSTSDGLDVLKRLIADADVLVENFRPGVLDKKGLGWDDCKAINPSLIYCSISGYGQDSILKHNPAYDHIAQAMSGLMSLQGTENDPPTKVGFPLIDTFSGHMAAYSILAALLRRERGGEGQRIDVSMLDASMVLMSSMILKYLATGEVPPRVGNKGFSLSATADMFSTKDRPISIGANTNAQFASLCRVLGLEHLIGNPDYGDAAGRWKHADVLRAEVSGAIANWESEALEIELNANDVPAAVVRDLAGIVNHPHFNDRTTFYDVDVPAWDKSSRIINAGFQTDSDGPGTTAPSPDLGEHTETILSDLGFDAQTISAFKDRKIV